MAPTHIPNLIILRDLYYQLKSVKANQRGSKIFISLFSLAYNDPPPKYVPRDSPAPDATQHPQDSWFSDLRRFFQPSQSQSDSPREPLLQGYNNSYLNFRNYEEPFRRCKFELLS